MKTQTIISPQTFQMLNQSKEYHSICHYARYSQYIRNKGYQGMQNTRGAKEFSLQYLARVVRVYVYIYIYTYVYYLYVYIYIYITITRSIKNMCHIKQYTK